MIETIIPCAVLTFLVAGAIWCCLYEKRLWNNGICAAYGERWVQFDTDSQGGRGYKCRDLTIWISWPVDRVKPAFAGAGR